MSSGDESVDILDEIDLIEEVEGEVDNPIETIEEPTEEEATANTGNKDSDDDESSKKVVKPKRVIRNPQPKLNEQTLRTSKGLPALTNHFKRVKFKGRGHEAEDLNVLMKTYEYWCHRLFPKFPFDACIARLETLGTKRGTLVLMKKIRLGMEIADDDKKMESDEEQEGEAVTTEGFRDTFDNQFDQLFTGTRESERSSEPDTTEEQLERIRQNRLRAEALRKKRLEKTKSMFQNERNMNNNPSAGNVVSSADNISNIVNEDIECEKPEETEISSTRRTRVLSSDEEEIAHTEKLENDTEKGGSIRRKKILTIESDDEPDTNMEESPIDTITKIHSQGETQTNEIEADDGEVDLDNILNIVNKETETLNHNGTHQRLEQSEAQTDEMEEVDFDNILSIVNEDTEIPTSKSSHQNGQMPAYNNEMVRTDNNEEENSNNSTQKKNIQGIESDEEMDTDEFQQKQPSTEDSEII